jgi:hypothetical protein
MNKIKVLAAAAVLAALAFASAPKSQAQAAVQVNVGNPPECPYGYYDYAPYNCVPDGYYGPEWFNAGVFLGVGPWFHGPNDFQGKVDNTLDPQHGYSGDMPKRGDKVAETRKSPADFKGNESRDGRGHTAPEKK